MKKKFYRLRNVKYSLVLYMWCLTSEEQEFPAVGLYPLQ